MKQGNNIRRGRGRGQRKPHGTGSQHGGGMSKGNQTFDSNGPEIRVRGNAHQVLEKYLQMARDAGVIGDRVAAENYLQHAEHYYRQIAAQTEGQRPRVGGRELSVADVNVQNVSQGLSAALYAAPGLAADGTPGAGDEAGAAAPNGDYDDDEQDQFNGYQGGNQGQGNHNPGNQGQGNRENNGPDNRGSDGDGRGQRRFQRGSGRDNQRQDGQRHDGQRQDNQRQDNPRRDNQRQDGQRHDGQRQDGQRYDAQRQDGQRHDAQRDGQRQGGSRHEGGRQAEPRQAEPRHVEQGQDHRQDDNRANGNRPVETRQDNTPSAPIVVRGADRAAQEQPEYPSELLTQPVVVAPAIALPEAQPNLVQPGPVQPSLTLEPGGDAAAPMTDAAEAPVRRGRGRPRGSTNVAPRKTRAAAANADGETPPAPAGDGGE